MEWRPEFVGDSETKMIQGMLSYSAGMGTEISQTLLLMEIEPWDGTQKPKKEHRMLYIYLVIVMHLYVKLNLHANTQTFIVLGWHLGATL